MSLYNMVHGVNGLAPVLLSILNVKWNEIPRARDCYFDGQHIVVYTRTGGGNRDFYENLESCMANYPEYFEDGKEDDWPDGPWNDDLRQLPGYDWDEDDEYDNTYASFYYNVPEQFNFILEKLRSMAMKETQQERWEAVFERIQTASSNDPLIQRMTEAFAPVFQAVSDQNKTSE